MKKLYYLLACLYLFSREGYAQTDSTKFQELNPQSSLFQLPRAKLLEMSIRKLPVTVSIASKISENIQEAPGVIQVITKEEIEAYGYTQLYDILNRATGMFVFSTYLYNKSAVTLRGDRPINHMNHHVLIMVNGRPFRETTFTGLDMPVITAFPVQTIERIEIIRGPGAVLYGSNAFTGSINIVTKTKKEKVNLKVGLGNQGNNHFEGYAVNEVRKVNITGGIYANTQSGELFHGVDEIGVPFEYNMRDNSYGAMLAMNKGGFNSTLFLGYNTQGHIGLSPLVTLPLANVDPTGIVFDSRRVNTVRGSIDLSYEKELGNDWSASMNVSACFFDLVLNYLRGGLLSTNSADYLLESTFQYTGIRNMNLIFGTSATFLTGKSTTLSLDYFEKWYSMYVQADYKPISALKIIGGVQLNRPLPDVFAVVPRLGLVCNPHPNTGIKLLYGHAFRSAMPFELWLNSYPVLVGNEHLRPELVENLDLQLFYTRPDLTVSLTGFTYRQTDLVSRSPAINGGVPTYTNQGKFSGYGIELEGKIQKNGFGVNYALTYQKNELIDQLGTEGADTTIVNYSLMPNLMPKIGCYYNQDQFGMGIFYNGLFSMHEPQGSTSRNPFAENINLVSCNVFVDVLKLFKAQHRESLRIEFYVDNLLNEEFWYPEFVRRSLNTVPGYQRRLTRLSLSYRF